MRSDIFEKKQKNNLVNLLEYRDGMIPAGILVFSRKKQYNKSRKRAGALGKGWVMMMNNRQKVSTYTIAAVGMMAAMVFVASGLRIVIPIGMDNAAVHFGNIFCLLAGLLLGGVRGGLAAGIGSAFFDLSNPLYVRSAPFTFLFKFLMAYVCGVLSHKRGRMASSARWNLAAGIAGQLTYLALYLGKGFLEKILEGALWQSAAVVQLAKLPASGFNAVVAVIVSAALAPVFLQAMKKSNIYSKLYPAGGR